jgi:integrase
MSPIPAERSKNGHAHTVPLSAMALRLIPEEGFGVSKNVVSDIVWRYQQVTERWTAHDLRRSALTKMAELGIPPIVLGHIANPRTTTKAGITLGAYVHHAYEREKSEALELWANRLQGIISGAANVVPMRGKA